MHPGAGLQCQVMEGKGRTLTSKKHHEIGDVIFVEPPLHIVCEEAGDPDFEEIKKLCDVEGDMDYDPLWYWCALRSLTDADLPSNSRITTVAAEVQRRLLLLHRPETTEISESVDRVAKACGLEGKEELLEDLLQVWIHNCFEYQETPTGYSTYFAPAFMSHSCLPNADWVNDPEGNFVLKSRRVINEGDEICVSYLSEEALLDCTKTRVDDLDSTKGFVCTCPRCVANEDPSRVFACPSCSLGEVTFPSQAPLMSEDMEAIDSFDVFPSCATCGRELTRDGFKACLRIESRIGNILESLEAKPISRHNAGEFLSSMEVKQLRRLSQLGTHDKHGLSAKLLHILVDYHVFTKEYSEAIKCIDTYLDFCERVYDGLNGARSWALEEKGDILLEMATYEILIERNSSKFSSFSSQSIRRMFFYGTFAGDEIRKLASSLILEKLFVGLLAFVVKACLFQTYEKAADELKLLFGDWHEYHTKVHEKIIKAQRKLALS
ncbi:hypothetical protein FOZ61_010014 [Perkinsus olseni]|uniref:SET domain-containing protein n=1 Tax=Perkinsus olseni TaxID=32597 RepID=A0A7J6KZE9_PEROL|nr:hypothetical protein FOZ61_010014 [Perkinsus olseni]